ncbi:MAG: IS110 family transposase [Dehalococcoidia bacterium]|nr:IS110 family transposase [Dehalococcoidia bacterium]
MSRLCVGLDVSQKSVAACFLLDDGSEPLKRFSFEHNPAGVDKLVAKINATAQQLGTDQLLIGMETTGLLWWHLSEALRNSPELEHLHPAVYAINAKLVAKFKESYSDLDKTDSVDAFVIADRVRFGRLPKIAEPDERYLAIQKLTRHRFHLTNSLAREKNRFLTHLFLKFSVFCQQDFFSDTFGATSSALLTEFLSVDEIAGMPLEDLTNFLVKKSNGHFDDPETLAKSIKQAAKNSYRLTKYLADPVNVVLAMTLENIRFFEKQIAAIEKAITRELAAFPGAQVLLSIPGLGPVYTAGIIAEVQDVNRFDTDAQLARFAAIVWKKNQSGEFEAEETPMKHAGNHYLRYYLIEAANSLRMHNEEYAAYYQTKLREAAKHKHKRACVLTARKLVRLIHTLLRKGQLYQTLDQRKEAPAALPAGMTPGELARQVVRHRQAKGSLRIHLDH